MNEGGECKRRRCSNERGKKREREGVKFFHSLRESRLSLRDSLSLSLSSPSSAKMKLFGLLAFTLLASLASCSSSSAPPLTSDVVPSVDPELNWLTPQEFKVGRRIARSRSLLSLAFVRIRAWPVSSQDNSALLGTLETEEKSSPSPELTMREREIEEKRNTAFFSLQLSAIDAAAPSRLGLLSPPSPLSPPSNSLQLPTTQNNTRTSTSGPTPSPSCTSSRAPGAPPATL